MPSTPSVRRAPAAPTDAARAAAPVARRARHLMDPTAPRRSVDQAAVVRSEKSLTSVQRWVMSALVVTTILHLAVGVAVAAVFLEQPQLSAEIGLNVIAAAFGVIAVASGFALHGRSMLTPWLLLGLLPCAVGLWLTLG